MDEREREKAVILCDSSSHLCAFALSFSIFRVVVGSMGLRGSRHRRISVRAV